MAHGKKRKPTQRAKKAYGSLIVKAFKRAQPGGKIYAAIKKHHPSMIHH